MRTTGKFAARKFAARSGETDINCRIEFHADRSGMDLKIIYMLDGGPPYKYREAAVSMSFEEAATLAKQIVGSMAHSHQLIRKATNA